MGVSFLTFWGLGNLTFGAYFFYVLGLVILTFGCKFSYCGLVFLRLVVSNSYVLGVSDSYVLELVFLRFGDSNSFVRGLFFLRFGVSFLTFGA